MAQAQNRQGRPKGASLLRLIGLFKLLKGLVLIAAAISVFHLINKDIAQLIIDWSRALHIAPGNRFIERLIERALTVTNRQLIVLGVVLIAYSGMFTVEGIGLLMLQHWAEWMTVITTSALIPFELYELRKPTWLKALTLVVNVAAAVYIVYDVRNEARQTRAESATAP